MWCSFQDQKFHLDHIIHIVSLSVAMLFLTATLDVIQADSCIFLQDLQILQQHDLKQFFELKDES